MKLYLSQHGEQLPKDDDANEPLSEKGKTDVTNVASFFSPETVEVNKIQHSVKQRAKETAELFAELIPLDVKIEERQGLKAMDDVQAMAHEVNALSENIMLVGHLPFMEKLCGILLTDNENRRPVIFERGCLVCLELEEGQWSINWVVKPGLF